ncbi:hypothetical protein ScPMuIL_014550, partial [Solemya velum]
ACGGVSVIVNNRTPHSPVSLNTNLQAVAVRVTLHKTITVCSLYLPPSSTINISDLDHLVTQLPTPFMLLGDFNGHNYLWGCRDINAKGKLIEDFISKHNLCLFNNKTSTYLHPASGSYTSIDLSICDPSVFLDFTWRVDDDLHGSDHFPIILDTTGPNQPDRAPRWNLPKADWTKFQNLCEDRLSHFTVKDDQDPIEIFTSILHDVATEAIPKTSST